MYCKILSLVIKTIFKLILKIFGGRMADLYGTKWVFGIGTFISGVLTILTPFATWHDYKTLVALRIILGAGQVSFCLFFSNKKEKVT